MFKLAVTTQEGVDEVTGAVMFEVDDNNVVYNIALTRGRSSITDRFRASTLMMSVLLNTAQHNWLQGIEIGGQLQVKIIYDDRTLQSTRFTGRVTDLTLTHPDGDQSALLEIDAVGAYAEMNTQRTGDDFMYENSADGRFLELCADAGVEGQINLDPDSPMLYGKENRNGSVSNAMEAIAESIGATVFDNQQGQLVLQRYYDRLGLMIRESHENWEDNPQSWAETPGTWLGKPKDITLPTIVLPAKSIQYEPRWKQFSGAIANSFTIKYWLGQVGVADPDSIGKYGLREVEVDTDLLEMDDAIVRTGQLYNGFNEPQWTMSQCSVILGELDSDLFHELTRYELIGRRVMITGLPQPAPYTSVTMFVEGVQEVYTPRGWVWTLSLSPRVWSTPGVRWFEPGPDYTWEKATLAWDEAVVPEAFPEQDLFPTKSKILEVA